MLDRDLHSGQVGQISTAVNSMCQIIDHRLGKSDYQIRSASQDRTVEGSCSFLPLRRDRPALPRDDWLSRHWGRSSQSGPASRGLGEFLLNAVARVQVRTETLCCMSSPPSLYIYIYIKTSLTERPSSSKHVKSCVLFPPELHPDFFLCFWNNSCSCWTLCSLNISTCCFGAHAEMTNGAVSLRTVTYNDPPVMTWWWFSLLYKTCRYHRLTLVWKFESESVKYWAQRDMTDSRAVQSAEVKP